MSSPPTADKQEVSVEPPLSALSMTLPTFAVECERLQNGARSYLSISAADTGAQQQTRRPPVLLSIERTDRRTDVRPTVTQTLLFILCGQRQQKLQLPMQYVACRQNIHHAASCNPTGYTPSQKSFVSLAFFPFRRHDGSS